MEKNEISLVEPIRKMRLKHFNKHNQLDISRDIIGKIQKVSRKSVRLMEVCGTHTVSIFKSGLRALLPDTISLISGPGCPVCVTAQKEIDTFIALSRQNDVILTTFGDLLRVPGTESSLQMERAMGRDIRIVYSPIDALEIAKKHPDKKIVFSGIGFETTAPTIAATILAAREMKIRNFLVFSAHKIVPPALDALMQINESNHHINGFLLPGHVSVIIGVKGYLDFFNAHHIPCVISGFSPVDILWALLRLVTQIETGYPELENCYSSTVAFEGNQKARQIMQTVFESMDSNWRGIGTIMKSGLKIQNEFSEFDAQKAFELNIPYHRKQINCSCGDILTGLKIPPDCPLYKTKCTPLNPIGPCMVSSEGTCASYYRYYFKDDLSRKPISCS
jgi:hydrogenase expression/formation protein HypD